jgi:hypothetical protein
VGYVDAATQPDVMIIEHYRAGVWTEQGRWPVTTLLRRLEDLQRYLETISATLALIVRAEHLDEERVRVRVVNQRGQILAVVHGGGEITVA